MKRSRSSLTILFCSGAFLCLLLIGGEYLLAMLATLAVLAFLFAAHYVIWGRSVEREGEAPARRGDSLDVSRPHR